MDFYCQVSKLNIDIRYENNSVLKEDTEISRRESRKGSLGTQLIFSKGSVLAQFVFVVCLFVLIENRFFPLRQYIQTTVSLPSTPSTPPHTHTSLLLQIHSPLVSSSAKSRPPRDNSQTEQNKIQQHRTKAFTYLGCTRHPNRRKRVPRSGKHQRDICFCC